MSDKQPNGTVGPYNDGDAGGNGHDRFEVEAEPLQQQEFRLTSFSINNRMTVYVLTGLITIMGIVSYLSIPKEAQPEIVIPIVFVATPYFGVSPSDIESQITQPIEKELKGITGIKKITSISQEGYSGITVEFNPDVNMDAALQKVRDKVDLAKKDLPKDAEEPQIQEINTSEFPIININISGDYSLVKLKQIAEDMQDHIESFPEILEVVISGGLEQEVQVNADLHKLQYYNVSFNDIINAIRNENTTIPGGTIDVENMKYLVRVPGEFERPQIIEDIVVKRPEGGGAPIYVRDVATVDFAFKDRTTYARLDGSSVVTMAVKKRAGTNVIEVSDKVKSYISDLEKSGTLPPSTQIKLTNDQSDMIRDMVDNLQNSIIFGLILVVLVLLFFMGVRNAVLVGIAVPLSMLLSFLIIAALGFTMNMIVLFSLILALGMLVDNAIVVVENIYRYLNEGYDKITAAKLATGEVAIPITTSTLTTLFAFLPMAFWPGIVGEFMKFLPITLIITLGSSLFVALVINPTLSSALMRVDGEKGQQLTRTGKIIVGVLGALVLLMIASANLITAMTAVAGIILFYLTNRFVFTPVGGWLRDKGFPGWQRMYLSTLKFALNHRITVFVSMFVVLIGTVIAFSSNNAGMEFFPNIEPRNVNVQIESSIGTNVEQSNRIAKELEQRVSHVPGYSDVTAVVTTVGVGGGGGFSGAGGGAPNKATIAISFKKYQDRKQSPFETLAELRGVMGTTLAGADVKVTKMEMGPPTGKPVSIEIRGDDFAVISRESAKILNLIKASPVAPKLDALESNLNDGRPEMTVRIDREKAALYGLNTSLIGSTIRSAVNGTEASKYRQGDDDYEINVRLMPDQRDHLESLGDLVIQKDGKQIPLSAVASWEVTSGFGAINRKNLDRVVTIQADVVEGNNTNEILADLKTLLDKNYKAPPGYSVAFTGQQEEQAETGRFLGLAFTVALLLVFGTLVAQFNSVVTPFIIMFSVIFSTIGVLIGLMVFQIPFGMVMTGIGVISLAGVAVNNAIVLIDFIEVRRKRDGLPRRQAILEAGVTRLRPVFLTTATTVLGLVPLALGLNFDFFGLFTSLEPNIFMGGEQAQWWFSLCVAVIFGLSFATFLTLVVVPVMYSLADSVNTWLKKVLFGKSAVAEEPHPAYTNGRAVGTQKPAVVET